MANNSNKEISIVPYVSRTMLQEKFQSLSAREHNLNRCVGMAMITYLGEISGSTCGLLWYAQGMLEVKEKSEHLKHETKKSNYDPDHK